MKNKKELVAITDEVKLQISEVDVAPPLLYQTLFNNLLVTKNIELEDENRIVNTILDEKLLKIKKLNNNTSEHIVKLDNSAKSAIEAIKYKDDAKLKKVLEETADLRREIEKLKASIFIDSLTKAYNRQWFYSHYMDENDTFTCKGILTFIDMNYFKDINDSYGHIAGDKVLEFTASHLKKTQAELIRYGGDEFLLFFDSSFTLEQVKNIMHNNRELIIKKVLKFKEYNFHTSSSYGVVSFENSDNFQDILTLADELMYQDKESFKYRLIIS